MVSKFKKTKEKFRQTRGWFEKNEKYLSIIFFIGGLIFDNLTLTRIDQLFDNLILLSYLGLAMMSIILINLAKEKNFQNKFFKFLPLLTQFAFGVLFSGYIIFYTKSATWGTSLFFLLIIFGIFIANERLRQEYKKIDFQINILFIAIFSFLIFFLPVISKQIGTEIFILSGVISFAIIYLLLLFLSKFILIINEKRGKRILKNLIGIYLIFNFMYFLNLIPPVPLSMKHIGVYKNVQRSVTGNYILKEYQQPWYQIGNYFIEVKEPIAYVYSSVFAPTDLNTTIINEWQKYNEETNNWVTIDKIEYPITGGREEGYRGYSFMSNLTPGKWRVDVKNLRNQTIGRIKFTVE